MSSISRHDQAQGLQGVGVMTHFGRFFLGGGQGINFLLRNPKNPVFGLNLTIFTLT